MSEIKVESCAVATWVRNTQVTTGCSYAKHWSYRISSIRRLFSPGWNHRWQFKGGEKDKEDWTNLDYRQQLIIREAETAEQKETRWLWTRQQQRVCTACHCTMCTVCRFVLQSEGSPLGVLHQCTCIIADTTPSLNAASNDLFFVKLLLEGGVWSRKYGTCKNVKIAVILCLHAWRLIVQDKR